MNALYFWDRLLDTDCLPCLAVERLADDVLDFGVTGRVGFADKQWLFRRKVASPIDQTQHGVGQVVAVHRRLRRAQHAGIEMRDQPVLVDLRYLLREERRAPLVVRSEEHTSELQSLMRISYAVFCLKKKTIKRL